MGNTHDFSAVGQFAYRINIQYFILSSQNIYKIQQQYSDRFQKTERYSPFNMRNHVPFTLKTFNKMENKEKDHHRDFPLH